VRVIIDADRHKEELRTYEVEVLPTVVLLAPDGQAVDRVGYGDLDQGREQIERVAGRYTRRD